MGQLNHHNGSPHGRIAFLAPKKGIKNPKTQGLIEHLAKQAGKRGAFHLLAEIDELAPAFEVLRKAGFGIYARQRIWKILETQNVNNETTKWQPIKDGDMIAVQTLFHNVVPGLVGQIESSPKKHLQGLVCLKGKDVIGYVDLRYGYQGIWAQPFIHPDVENIDEILGTMTCGIPDRRSRPIYICVRSYQSWLEPALGELDSLPSPLQAVMVKRLATRQKMALQGLPKINGQTEISAPVVQSRRNN
jgi:hypothetical protein